MANGLPDFQIVDSPKWFESSAGVSAYRLVLDVTDMVQRCQDNKLHLEYLAGTMNLRRYFPQTNPSLIWSSGSLIRRSGGEQSGRPRRSFTLTDSWLNRRRRWTWPGGQRAAGRRPEIDLPGMPVTLVSRFSYQGGGFNVLSPDGPAQSARVESERRPNRPEATVNAAAKEYRLRRDHFAGDHLMTDRLTNSPPRPSAWRSTTSWSAPPAILDAWLGGNGSGRDHRRQLENSSVFVAGRKGVRPVGCGRRVPHPVGALLQTEPAQRTFALGPNTHTS